MAIVPLYNVAVIICTLYTVAVIICPRSQQDREALIRFSGLLIENDTKGEAEHIPLRVGMGELSCICKDALLTHDIIKE